LSDTPPNSGGLTVAPWPQVDFSAFGPVETKSLSRIQVLVGGYLARNWVMIPHVTHQEEADITGLDAVRATLSTQTGVKITPLAFMVKAAVAALKAHPQFNASLDGTGRTLVLKKYFHVGIAVDTPGGLLVPVIRNADGKSVAELAAEIGDVSTLARTKGLSLDRMSGGCFTLSSLGSIGGTSFTPIINAPELAIMGITRAFQKPVNVAGALAWRTMLPLSLSYDHRVINGADAARFCLTFAQHLNDFATGNQQ
jgi:pyruvate dehydrogenase E2 component (dihydrolipoamide acetyltransferase)